MLELIVISTLNGVLFGMLLFLMASGLDAAFAQAYAQAGDEAARYASAQEVKKLTLPGEMGERFQAMLFARDLDSERLFAPLVAVDRSERL